VSPRKVRGEYRVEQLRVSLVRERAVGTPERKCGCSENSALLLHALLDDSPVERIYVLLLDGRNNVLAVEQIGQGGLHGCAIAARDVFRSAIVVGASAIVLGHNHPSGDPMPSQEDITLTTAVCAAGKVVGIPIADHVVVSPNGRHASMLLLGLIP